MIIPSDLYTGVIPYSLKFDLSCSSIFVCCIFLLWNIILDLFWLMIISLLVAQFSQVVMVSSNLASDEPTILVSSANIYGNTLFIESICPVRSFVNMLKSRQEILHP